MDVTKATIYVFEKESDNTVTYSTEEPEPCDSMQADSCNIEVEPLLCDGSDGQVMHESHDYNDSCSYLNNSQQGCKNCEMLLTMMKKQQKQIVALEKGVAKQAVMLTRLCNFFLPEEKEVDHSLPFQFPLKEDEKLQELEEYLSVKNNQNKLKQWIHRANGSGTLKQFLPNFIYFAVQCQYNCRGIRGKKKFTNYKNICNCLFDFREAFADFTVALEKCDFITIDCEMSGLSTENSRILPYDSLDQAYRKYVENTEGYIIIQLGVTLIQVPLANSADDTYTYHSYNFYVYPRSWKSSFLCQGSSIAFLAENGFDFTKLFREGVPCCDEQEEKSLRERLRERQKLRKEVRAGSKNTSFNHIPVPDEEKEAVERIRNEIEEFIKSQDDEKVIGGCNGFQRKLIYQLIEANFSDKVTASTKNADKVIIVTKRLSEAEENRIEEELQAEELRALDDNIGVSLIMQKISASRKPVIGHNFFLDLLFILRQFFGPLPQSLVEFKRFATRIFPSIIDTKHMCTLPKVKSVINSSVLGDIIQSISKEPLAIPKLKSGHVDHCYTLNDNKAHEAGYDSFLTAVAFLSIAVYFHGSVSKIVDDSNATNEYINRIFLVKLQDVGFIYLAGHEPVPCRKHVFHVNIPEEWRKSDLIHHFRNYGPIYITWINATSALISLHNKENSGSVLKTIGSHSGFKIQSFKDYKETLQYRVNGNEAAAPTQAKKRKLSSSYNAFDEGTAGKDTSSAQDATKAKIPKTTMSKHPVKGFRESEDW